MKTVFIYGTCGQYVDYLSVIRHAGGRVLLTRDLFRSFDCDALLLPGSDIGAALDATDRFLLQSFIASSRPVLGIDRGMQALNVYFGGTLHRYITAHQDPGGDLIHPVHNLGRLRQLFGPEMCVNSSHHRSVDQLGRDLLVLQQAEDGVVEALGHATKNVLGVQWHPERQCGITCPNGVDDAAPLFDYFLSL